MKARKWPSLIIAAFTILSLGSCEDWGQMDPPAGSDVYPKLEQVLNLKFDGDRVNSEEIQTFAYSGGDVPSLVTDEKMGQVLCLDNGYARIFNPYNKVKVQNAVSLVFYVKQAGTAEMTDEDEIAAYTQDLTGALFSFENQNGTQRMFITANGWLSYEGEDGRYEANNPNSANTGLLTPDVWHYVALSVTNTGYFVYVDGKKRIEQNVTDFDFSKIVQFMASVPYIYMGYGSDTQTKKFYLDDVKFYRNTITSKEWTDPRKPDGGEESSPYITIGNTDYTSNFFEPKSEQLVRSGDCIFHYQFYNYNNSGDNWNNWVLAVTNGKEFGADGYAEYFVLRADAYGWGDSNYNAANIIHGFNWDTFVADMQGALVDMTITRNGSKINVSVKTKTASGGALADYSFSYDGVSTTDIGTFITVNHSYIELSKAETYYGASYSTGDYRIGAQDCSAGWWTVFSQHTKIEGTNSALRYQFKNYTKGDENFKNWLVILTNGKDRPESGYEEYLVLRSDAFGWGARYNADNMTSGFDWSTFKTDMNGAEVVLEIKRADGRVDVISNVTTAAGKALPTYSIYFEDLEESAELGAFLTIEGGYIDMESVVTYPFIDVE